MAAETGLLEAIREAGFVYWGLFVAFGVILAAYLVWMRKATHADEEERPSTDRTGGEDGP